MSQPFCGMPKAAKPFRASAMHNTRMIIFERRSRRQGSATQPQDTRHEAGPLIQLDVSDAHNPSFISTLAYRLDARCTFLQQPDWWLYVATPVSMECFPALTTLLAQAPALGFDAVLERLEHFRLLAFVAGHQRNKSIHFGRSMDGFASLLFGHTTDHLVIADSRTEVAARLGEVQLSRHDEELWYREQLLEPEGSFYEGVKRSFAGVRYTVLPGALEPNRRRFMAPESQVQQGTDPVQLLTDGLRAIFTTYGNHKVALRLSGGADSRVLLVGLMDAVRQGILRRDQILCTSVLFPGFDCDEGAPIRRIIELAGFEWLGIEATAENVRRAAHEQCLQLPVPPFPTAFMGALCAKEAHHRGASLLITGHGGDELFGFNLIDLLGHPLGTRLRNLAVLQTLRGVHGWKDALKGVARALAGRRYLPGIQAFLREHQLPPATLHAHRLGRRLVLAQGCGYESIDHVSAQFSLLTDAPLFRAPLFMQMDPSAPAHSRDGPAKTIAHQYLRTHAPQIDAVECRKVVFNSVVADYLAPEPSICDSVDGQPAAFYAAREGYHAWRVLRATKRKYDS